MPNKSIERSIDTLQRIYAVVVALAISEALKRTFLPGGIETPSMRLAFLPVCIAFFATVIPFLHGMNRHLDDALDEARKQKRTRLYIMLIIDFVVFIVEACALFLLATSVGSPLQFAWLFVFLLGVDVVWSFVAWCFTGSPVVRWACVNLPMLALVVCACLWIQCLIVNKWPLAVILVIRTILDYSLAWRFYFPTEGTAPPARVTP